MYRLASYLGFFTVSLIVVIGAHYYLWLRLVRDPAWPAPWRAWATAALVMLAVSMPLAMALARTVGGEWLKPLVWVAYFWMGIMFLLVLSFGLLDLGRFALLVARSMFQPGGGVDPERRVALLRLFGTGAAALVGASAAWGYRAATRVPDVVRVRVPLRRLPRALDGSTIVQLTDIHIGPTIEGDWLRRVVERVNSLEPDVVAITGDLVDGSVAQLAPHVAPLGELRARYGTYFVTGNHEYYSGAEAWVAYLNQIGVRVLRNERVTIGGGDACYELVGVDDPAGRRLAGHGPDLARARGLPQRARARAARTSAPSHL